MTGWPQLPPIIPSPYDPSGGPGAGFLRNLGSGLKDTLLGLVGLAVIWV
jgi:hypothetical protein